MMKHVYFLTKLFKRLAFLLLLLSGINHLSVAQAPTIAYPAAASNLTRGYSQGLLTVRVIFNEVCSGTVRLGLPASVTYVAGSVTKIGGTAGISIAESSIADLSKPAFSISGVAAIGDEISFTVARRAGCGTLTTAKDSVYFVAGAGCSSTSEVAATVNTYNLITPSLGITPSSALVNTTVGFTTTRTTTVINGAPGCTDTLRFYIVYPSAGIVNTNSNKITVSSVDFSPWRSNGDTLFYKIAGAAMFGGDGLLCNTESVVINEPIRVAKCNTTTTYAAYWSANQWPGCQTVSGTSSMTMLTGAQNVSITVSDSTLVKACSPGISKYVYTNSGSGAVVGALFNVIANMGFSELGGALFRTSAGEVLSDFTFGARPGVGTALTVTTTASAFVANMNQFTSDPDGAGIGLDDIDGDGQYDDLAPGKSFVIYFYRYYNPNTGCPRAEYSHSVGTTITYNNMCGTSFTTLSSAGFGGQRSLYTIPIRTFSLDPQIIGGTPFNVTITHSSALTTAVSQAVDSFELTITLPAGLTYAGNAKYKGTVLSSVVVSGSQVTFYKKGESGTNNLWGLQAFSFDLLYDCSAGSGIFSVPFELQYVNDRSCSITERLYCSSFSVNALCPTAVCPDGIGNTNVRVARQTIGWTDTTMTTKVVAASLSKQTLATVAPLDTVTVTSSGKQGTIAYNNLHYYFEISKASGQSVLSFINGTLNYLPGGGGTVVSKVISTPTDLSTASLTKWDWNLSSLMGSGGIPATMIAGDSVWVSVTFQVTRANNSNLFGLLKPEYAPTANAYLYSTGSGSVQKYCDILFTPIRFVGYDQKSVNVYANGGQGTLVGCNRVYINFAFSSGHGNTIQPFAGEYRPKVYFDSIVITLPTGVTYDASVTPNYMYTYYANVYSYSTSIKLIPHPVIRGQDLIFVNTGNFVMSDFTPFGNQIDSRLFFYVKSDCAVGNISGNLPLTVKYYGKDYQWATPVPAIPSILTTTPFTTSALILDGAKRPTLTVQNNTGIVQGFSSTHYWDVQINSTGSTTAAYLWMALEKGAGSGGVLVDSVKLMPSGTTLSLTGVYNTTDKWYQISTVGLASGTNQQARIFFHYTACTLDSILLKAGWNCSAYPSPDASTYPCVAAQTYLKVDPQPSQVQLALTRQPGGGSSISLCTTDSALLVVNSTQSANLINPYVTIFPPAGMSLVSPVRVEYPLGSGNYQNATVTSLSAGGYKIELSAHTGIGTSGILGTAKASPSYSPAGGDRQAKIRLDFNTDCSYASGSSFTLRGYGYQPCGAVALDNGTTATTTALNITGAAATGSGGGTLSFGATTLSCGIPATLSLSTVPTGAPTQAGDTVIYTLPPGLVYTGGFAKGTNCTTCEIVASAASNKVKIKLQTGVAATNALAYSFNVAPNTAGCGTVNIFSEFKRDISALMCGATACSSSSVVIASGTSPDISLQKPNLQISDVGLIDTNIWIMGWGYPNKVRVKYNNNNGTQAYTGGVDSVEFFCGSSTTSFATKPLTKSLAIGASDSDSYIVFVAPVTCTVGELVTAKIKGTTSAGTQQCICSESNFLMAGAPLPLDFLTLNVNVEDCAVAVNWTYNLTGNNQLQSFIIERSREGSGFDKVASLEPAAQSYTDVTPNAGLWLYRIKAIGTDGKSVYSNAMKVLTSKCNGNKVSVYPNPASDLLQIVLQGNASDCYYSLTDVFGRLVQEGDLKSNSNNTVSIVNLSTATYLLKVVVDGTASMQQIHVIK